MSSIVASGSRASTMAGMPAVNATRVPIHADADPSTSAMGAVGPPVATTISSHVESGFSTSGFSTSENILFTSEETLITSSSPLPTSQIPVPVTSAPSPATTTSLDLQPVTSAVPSSPPSSSPLFSIPVIIGIAVGGAAILLIVAGGCWFLGRSRRSRRRSRRDDDGLGMFKPPKNRRERPIRAGYARQEGSSQPHLPPPLQPPRAGLSRAEARASVQFYGHSAPVKPFDTQTFQTTSAWTDNSEMDVFAVDGSSYARTLSTMSRPNSEYDLEDDPSTYQDGGTYPTHFAPFSIYSQRELQTPPPVGYPPFHSSPSGTFGPSTPQRRNAPDPSIYGPVGVSPHVVPVGGVVGGVAGMVAPAPSQMALPGPSRRPDGRIPAPKLLVDTKAPFENVPLSAVGPSSHPLSAMQTPLSTLGGWSSGMPTPLDRAPSTRALSPENTIMPPSRSASRGAAFTPVPTPTTYTPQRPATAYAGPSYSRPLVTRQTSRSDDRPSALPYAGNAKEEPGLQRGPTIIRHADAGAFEDAVPDEQGEVHLPPAYDEIYARNP